MVILDRKGPIRRFLEDWEPIIRRKKIFSSGEPQQKPSSEASVLRSKQEISRPESGRTFVGQSDESYCLECIEGHTMIALTEIRHALDRYRSAGKMTPGVTEKVRVAIQELQGIVEDIKSTEAASPELKKELDEILDEVRWIRKEFGISGRGLTRGYGSEKDLIELRNRVLMLQNKAYRLAERCPTCRIRR